MRLNNQQNILAICFFLVGAAIMLYEALTKQHDWVRILIGIVCVMIFLYRIIKKIFLRYISKNWNTTFAKVTSMYYPQTLGAYDGRNFLLCQIEVKEVDGSRIFKTKTRLNRTDYTKYYGMKVPVYYHPTHTDIYFIDIELAERELTEGD